MNFGPSIYTLLNRLNELSLACKTRLINSLFIYIGKNNPLKIIMCLAGFAFTFQRQTFSQEAFLISITTANSSAGVTEKDLITE